MIALNTLDFKLCTTRLHKEGHLVESAKKQNELQILLYVIKMLIAHTLLPMKADLGRVSVPLDAMTTWPLCQRWAFVCTPNTHT